MLTGATAVLGTIADSNLDSWTLQIAPVGTTNFTTLATGTAAADAGAGAAGSRGPAKRRLPTPSERNRHRGAQFHDRDNGGGGHVCQAGPIYAVGDRPHVSVGRCHGRSHPRLRFPESPHVHLDFGYGWSLAVQDANIQTSVPLTGREAAGIYNPFTEGTRVYLTLPTESAVSVSPSAPVRHEQSGVTWYTPSYTADSGVTWELASSSDVLIRGGSGFYDAVNGLPYIPGQRLLHPDHSTPSTARTDGLSPPVPRSRVQEEILPSGQVLYFSGSGISSSTGGAVQFLRDAAGRITSIEAPDGSREVYIYDAQGNLAEAHNTVTGQTSNYGHSASGRIC